MNEYLNNHLKQHNYDAAERQEKARRQNQANEVQRQQRARKRKQH